MYKKIIPFINCENELPVNVISEAVQYEIGGADELFVYNYSKDEASREEFLGAVKEITKHIDIPVYIGCYVERFEDVKKALYTGASYVMIKYSLLKNNNVVKEASERFGNDTIILELEDYKDIHNKDFIDIIKDLGVYALLLKHVELTKDLTDSINSLEIPVIIRDSLSSNDIASLLEPVTVLGISTNYYKNKDMFKVKLSLKAQNIEVNTFDSSIKFSEFKLNNDGLIPVVVQEYKTGEVLMVAYMNEEAFRKTIETGKMTYYSRSRSTLWTKGETSGHYQYVKALMLDCDKDTILAKVLQIGPACHTGNGSCFYTELVKKEYDDTNPLTVFNEVFNVILDRKKNPKEGSYTNYLFEKGIDKILKKCGEEATEIIIAAKNPDSEELKYEISDFLYHMMVLMAECNLDWSDIVKELAHRR
ncbi:bifunctional phosphoribosyl-AMP cyclohydrolase/phosphoribosyl-ATP diphosphatase HisIE [Anaerocolumna sedimenticola]|uniref:Histidine biosynthesis bifunctional protein HisIE n=1 Tax=Anaerocolumna sedimenticola TaxID=2696063 RepID=A0A6P1TQT9_9FIRM|nr:bifunctional phosphoribosyl-AMP cyclohydrolase/phosphoribosyl-ATP diphosphatase HisIE [Anaerocolumna sedimenticola]QHQ62126.1 bifunctional phosphoribosyl-AMP cyclohydrolase/phosphoribosyl-ATP diphosphatase HisIE [Anaerocolumna sedimenticola]